MTREFAEFINEIWRYKPSIVILFVGGGLILLLLIIDTYRHRKQLKKRHRDKRPH